MLQRIATVALSTYRESVRARILIGLAGIALAVAGYSLTVAAYTLNDAPRVIADLGTTATSLFGVLVAIVIGISRVDVGYSRRFRCTFLIRSVVPSRLGKRRPLARS